MAKFWNIFISGTARGTVPPFFRSRGNNRIEIYTLVLYYYRSNLGDWLAALANIFTYLIDIIKLTKLLRTSITAAGNCYKYVRHTTAPVANVCPSLNRDWSILLLDTKNLLLLVNNNCDSKQQPTLTCAHNKHFRHFSLVAIPDTSFCCSILQLLLLVVVVSENLVHFYRLCSEPALLADS